MSPINLKSCPFCGGDGAFREHAMDARFGTTQMKVECMVCQIVTPRGNISMDNFKCPIERATAMRVAAERWNTREEPINK